MLRTIAFVLSLVFLLSGCLKESESRCDYDPCAYKAPAAEIQEVRDYLAANNLTATEHCSGLFYRIESEGTGAQPNACSYVVANYKGKFTSGAVFDESSQGPVGFYLNRVVQGWTNGLPLIKTGGRIILYIPPSLGYRDQDVKNQQGQVVIPANSMLVFEVDLLSVQ